MKTPRHQVAALLADRTLESGFDEADFSQSIAAYLLDTNRTGELESLLRDIMQERADRGIVEVVAISAHDITPAIEANIRAHIKELYPAAKQIIITKQLDAAVVGGIRLELANQQLDLSIRSKLNRFKQLTTAGKD